MIRQIRLAVVALLAFAVPVLAQDQPKPLEPQVQHTKCRVEADPETESNRVLVCFDEVAKEEFTRTVGANHPWARFLVDAQFGVTTVIIEGHEDKVCLRQVRHLGELVKNPVNERINVCITVKRRTKL